MPIDSVTLQPWTRKHDDPRFDLIPKAPEIVYPKDLGELIQLCRIRPAGQRFKAAGSHWALSPAAISDHTFIETNDPRNVHQAMGRTLHDVIPGCMNENYLKALGENFAPTETFIHVEAGKRIFQLYAELDTPDNLSNKNSLARRISDRFNNGSYARSWAFQTLGGAGGQTVVGALNTGTHGGDFTLPPIPDSVVALHLVADGGRHYWIEPSPAHVLEDTPIVDFEKLAELYDTPEFAGPGNFEVIRDNSVFDAVLVSAGRFGIIYSVVLRAVSQYMLHEQRRLSIWQDIKDMIKDLNGPLYTDPILGSLHSRFLQVAVCLTPHHNFQRNLAGITKRWNGSAVPVMDPPGRKERVGAIENAFDQRIQAPLFAKAGRTHGYSPDPDNPGQAADPGMLEQACANASFLKGILIAVIDEIQEFVAKNGAVIGVGMAGVAVAGGVGLALLFPAFLAFLIILKKILDELDADDRFGEFMEGIKNELLDPDEKDPLKRAAGLFIWQLIVYKAFESQQEEHDFDAISYAMMDRKDYLNISCEVNVDSVEVFFDAVDDRLITFVDALIAYEIMQEFRGLAFAGYASLRFMRPSRALIGMQKHHVTCAVEVACLRDVSGGQALVDYAATLARNPNINGLLHWGQHNDYTMADVEHRYGDSAFAPGGALGTWRSALSRITDNGRRDGFSSEFTRYTGLEVVQPRIQGFAVDRTAASIGEKVTISWNCLDNPPDSRVSILIGRPAGGSTVINTIPLAGTHHFLVTERGTHSINFYVTRTLNKVHRRDSRTAFITVK
ncbi:MAG: hypothetical protein WBD22_10790 [Pyrinomonadaceae bacterium]